jgi:hypothetical protein
MRLIDGLKNCAHVTRAEVALPLHDGVVDWFEFRILCFGRRPQVKMQRVNTLFARYLFLALYVENH